MHTNTTRQHNQKEQIEPENHHESNRKRSRSRSRDKPQAKRKDPVQNSPSRVNANSKDSHQSPKRQTNSAQKVEVSEDQEVTDELLQKVMGFSGFGTSKGKDHSSSSVECVQKLSQVRRKYRQYMNRRGGFNRNLDAMKD